MATQYYWFQAIEPYVGQRWNQPVYDCPGFPFDPKHRWDQAFGFIPYGEYDYNYVEVPSREQQGPRYRIADELHYAKSRCIRMPIILHDQTSCATRISL